LERLTPSHLKLSELGSQFSICFFAVADLGEGPGGGGGPKNPKKLQKEEKPAVHAKITTPPLARGLDPPLLCGHFLPFATLVSNLKLSTISILTEKI